MNEMQIFNNPEFGKVRTIVIDGEPWFVGKDVCRAFGDTNHRRSLKRVDDEDKRTIEIQTNGGKQHVTIINESGLYTLLFAMQPQKANVNGGGETPPRDREGDANAYPPDKKEEADAYPPDIQARIDRLRRFKRWVTSEVLPTIRKQGGYLTPEAAEQLATSVQALADRVTALEDAATDPFAFAVPAPAPLPEGGVQKPQAPGRDYMKRWMRTASEKLELMSNKFNMGNNAILHKLYGYIEEEFGVVLADERLRIMEEYGLEDCSTLKAVFYEEDFRDYLEVLIDHNLAPENRGW